MHNDLHAPSRQTWRVLAFVWKLQRNSSIKSVEVWKGSLVYISVTNLRMRCGKMFAATRSGSRRFLLLRRPKVKLRVKFDLFPPLGSVGAPPATHYRPRCDHDFRCPCKTGITGPSRGTASNWGRNMPSSDYDEVRFQLRKAILLYANAVAHPHRWLWEKERWSELVFALLTRATSVPERSVREAVNALSALDLLEPVREHIESSESFVIQGKRPDSIGGVVDVDEQESRTL